MAGEYSHNYSTRFQMAQHGRGGGRGAHRDNHSRVGDKPGAGGAGKQRYNDDDFKKEIIDGVVQRLTEILGPQLRTLPQIQDQLHGLMDEHAVGLSPRFNSDVNFSVDFGSRESTRVLNVDADVCLDTYRVGDSPYILVSAARSILERLQRNGAAPEVPHDLVHGKWDTELFKTRVVYLRVPVYGFRRFSTKEDIGENSGYTFMCFRVLPDDWVYRKPEEGFEIPNRWLTYINKAKWEKVQNIFRSKNEKFSPNEKFKLFTFAYDETGEPLHQPTDDIYGTKYA